MSIRRIGLRSDFGKLLTFGSAGAAGIEKTSNYFGNGADGALTTTGSVTLTSTQDSDMIVKNYTDVTINVGHTLTVSNRCKGLLLFVDGDLTVAGTISMSLRGASVAPISAGVSATGLRMPFKTSGGSQTLLTGDLAGCGAAAIAAAANFPEIASDGTIITIPRTGAAGAAGRGTGGGDSHGINGNAGSSGQTGGGGSGASHNSYYSGAGGDGTCFSGGTGSGGAYQGNTLDGSDYGGAGSAASSLTQNANGGGSGNPGGAGYTAGAPTYNGQNGTGGLLIIICSGTVTVSSGGYIVANGVRGGNANNTLYGGGATGGGSIALIYGTGYSNSGTVQAVGGVGGTGGYFNGGAGGAGSIQTLQVLS